MIHHIQFKTLTFCCFLLLTFHSSFSQVPVMHFDWARQICNSQGNDNYYAMAVDPSGNVIAGGRFAGTVDMDPGPGTFNLTAQNSIYNIFLQKLDSEGKLIWALQFPDGGFDEDLNAIQTDSQGNIYTVVRFSNSVDLDPGPGVQNVNYPSFATFLLKLDPSGNLIWHKKLGEGPWNHFDPTELHLSDQGEFFLTGRLADSTDVDPSPNQHWLVPSNNNVDGEPFLVKLDSNGDFVFARSFPTTVRGRGISIRSLPSGDIWLSGFFAGVSDFTNGQSTISSTSSNNADIFLLKLSPNGVTTDVKAIQGFFTGVPTDLEVDSSGIFLSGVFRGTYDFDPGPGSQTLTSSLDHGFLLKWDLNGNFLWVEDLGYTNAVSTNPLDPKMAFGLDGDLWVTNIGTSSPGKRIMKYGSQSGQQLWDINLSLDIWHLETLGPAIYAGGFFEGSRNFHPNGNYTLSACGTWTDAFLFRWNDCYSAFDTLYVNSCDSYVAPWGQSLNASGVYTGTVANGNGCDSIITVNLSILPPATANAGPDQVVCRGESVTLNGTGGILQSWNQGVVNGQPFIPSQSGDYVLTTTNTEGCTATDTVNVAVIAPPIAQIQSFPDHLSASPSNLSYQWYTCDSVLNPIAGATNADFYPAASGNYTVVLDSGGCQDTAACTAFLLVGNSSPASPDLSLFPNPSRGKFKLQWPGTYARFECRVVNSQGKTLIQEHCVDCKEIMIDAETLPAGMYFIQSNGDGATACDKVVLLE